MDKISGYKKFIDRIGKDDFIRLFSGKEELGKWFSEKERKKFSFPGNAGSLAARYLVKKRITDYLGAETGMNGIEILNDEFSKPEIMTDERMKKKIRDNGVDVILCSLSHPRNYAVALTIFVMPPEGTKGESHNRPL